MKSLPHLLTLAGVAIGLGAASSSWWTLVLTTGSTLPVTGWDASAASSSLAVLALVAYGARWTFQGVVRRILAAIQVLASGGAVVAIISSASAPVESALSEITAATGVSGNAARERRWQGNGFRRRTRSPPALGPHCLTHLWRW